MTKKRSDWRVLICDEVGTHRNMVRKLVRDLGVGEVMESPVMFGQSKAVLQFKPNLIMGRIRPDNQDILELIHWLRTPALTPLPGVPILIAVSSPDKALLTTCIKAGADLLVAEPLTLAALQARIDSLITHPLPRFSTPNYFGPDRRRTPHPEYHGMERRGHDEPSQAESPAARTNVS